MKPKPSGHAMPEDPDWTPSDEDVMDAIRATRETIDRPPLHGFLGEDGHYHLTVNTAAAIMALPDPPDDYRLLGPLVFRGYRTIVVGDTGHGKTSFSLQMVAAILDGEEMLGHRGAGVGPGLVIDLEQGVRSIKRGIREAKLTEHVNALWVTVPDGLALDSDPEHWLALDQVFGTYRPVVVVLDPFYKAHRAEDPNAERPILDLMRTLDGFRARYGFALIMPAHPRKEQQAGSHGGLRKLTIHDVAGSGAITRGAEIVLGVERGGPGYARLRYLKDRDGDLQLGESIPMLYDKDRGFHLDERSTVTEDGVITRITERQFGWATSREWCKEIGVGHNPTLAMLKALASEDPPRVAYMVGPPGRASTAQCYSTMTDHLTERQQVFPVGLEHTDTPGNTGTPTGVPNALEHPGTPRYTLGDEGGRSPGVPPPPLRGVGPGTPPTPPADRTDDPGTVAPDFDPFPDL